MEDRQWHAFLPKELKWRVTVNISKQRKNENTQYKIVRKYYYTGVFIKDWMDVTYWYIRLCDNIKPLKEQSATVHIQM